ncbi:ABC transporter ATP-binding protein [Natrononativus amylolyticus]|uniref:ABC transporter ATP-binding protein n=1 Tax=Natrononativus amylolyticus TaxID=2963434 RepID=UPI0020CF512F|nr:ABC transporter ATP-binding protein [Natrononativus amylolyticus]
MTRDTETTRSPRERDDDPLLAVDELRTHIHTEQGTIRAVDGVSFSVGRGETVCIVGESGSGKSVTCESVTSILPQPPAEIVGGTIEFDGSSILEADDAFLRRLRGDRIAHVFQNPQQALDPVYAVGEQVVEAIAIHREIDDDEARERGIELLRRVGIPQAGARFDDYPHEFSGGQRQRIAIAIALAADPDLLIADEPTTAVDVTVQARLIELLGELTDGGMSMLLVTHNLRVVAALADRVVVMFGGTVVESGSVEAVFGRPAHPYTQALFDSYRGRPTDADRAARREVPTDGCRFRDQCPHAVEACASDDQPPFRSVAGHPAHTASCVYYGPDHEPDAVLGASGERNPIANENTDD